MQLRVARLCLDCEELHSENRCPRCASDSFAFLSTWLPSEERRRWRKPQAARVESGFGIGRLFARLFKADRGHEPLTPARRRSDLVPNLSFEELTANPAPEGPPKTADQTAPSSPRN
jgi:hypothetical protein